MGDVDFPLLEYNKDEHRYVALHHPFTGPFSWKISLNWMKIPLAVRAQAYDMVLNGFEIGGGSIRIHQSDLQQKVLNLLGITKDVAQRKIWFSS